MNSSGVNCEPFVFLTVSHCSEMGYLTVRLTTTVSLGSGVRAVTGT